MIDTGEKPVIGSRYSEEGWATEAQGQTRRYQVISSRGHSAEVFDSVGYVTTWVW
jgi:hypothetical protein